MPGASTSGGMRVNSEPTTWPSRASERVKSGHAAASRVDQSPMAAAACAGLAKIGSARPSGESAVQRIGCGRSESPCCARCSCSTTSARRGPVPVRQRRHAKARRQLVLGGAAAHLVALLEQQGAQPRLPQHRGAREAIDAAADDDDVVANGGHRGLRLPVSGARSPVSGGNQCQRSPPFDRVPDTGRRVPVHFPSIFSAAFFPGAPMMPPPGCVADPHMYRLLDRRRVLRPAGHRAAGRRAARASARPGRCCPR